MSPLDNYKSIYTGVAHLIESGYRRIGMISFKTNLVHMSERKRGYLSALEDNGMSLAKNWFKEVGLATINTEMPKAMYDLLQGPQPVDAILFASNAIALPGLKQLNDLSVQVPEEVAILSFDEAGAYDLFRTPLSYIRQPLAEMGEVAMKILLETIKKNNKITQVNLDSELVIKASTRPVDVLVRRSQAALS